MERIGKFFEGEIITQMYQLAHDVHDKQDANQSIITSTSNSKHESTAHVKDLVLVIVGEMNREIITQAK